MSQITDGTAQDDRFPASLADHYFDVDERHFEDLVSRTAEFAKSVNYYRVPDNVKDGHWAPLFASDEAVIISHILATDSTRMETEFLPLLEKGDPPIEAAIYLVNFAHRIDTWYRGLLGQEGPSADAISKHIESLVDKKLSHTLGLVAGMLGPATHSEITTKGQSMFADLHPIWKSDTASGHPRTDQRTLVRSTFYSLVSAVSNLKPIAAEQLQSTMANRTHEPAVALVLAFAKLIGVAQQKLNRFTARHRDFYYETVLGMKPNSPTPDSTFLVLNGAPRRSSLLIRSGTEFSAGKAADGTEIVYTADSDLNITDAQVRDLRTLFCSRDPQISPEIDLHYTCAVRSANILAGVSPGISWPLFGADKPEVEMSTGEHARIGFAVASSSLFLREGDRRISVTIAFRIPPDAKNVPPGPEGEAARLGEAVRRMIFKQTSQETLPEPQRDLLQKQFPDRYDLLRQDPAYIFQRVVGEAFTVDITVPTGWYSIPNHVVSLTKVGSDTDPYQISYSVVLGPDVPAIAGCDPAVHGDGYETKLPVIRFSINPRASIYPYSLFRDFQVEEIVVSSEVTDAIRNVAWNQNGQLDTSKPFNPFGPLPTSNSYLIVGNYDSARVHLTELTLKIEWGELPSMVGGFKEYYKGYPTEYSNEGFLVELSVLRDGRWRAGQNIPAARLFDTNPEGLKVAEERNIPLNVLEDFKRLDPTTSEEQFRYDQTARNGFFRLALKSPAAAFGHVEYPPYLSEVLTTNALRSRLRRDPDPLPDPPYTPIINRMTLAYKAQSAIRIGASSGRADSVYAEKMYYIRPFGVSTVNTLTSWTMLPMYESDGNLLIGFSATNPVGILTLLFHLREDSVSDLSPTPEPVSWFYLASDEWHPREDRRGEWHPGDFQVLSDTTEGFLTSGVVTLLIPGDITKNNTVMPANLYWIRVSAKKNLQSFCSLYNVQTQALSVTRKLVSQSAVSSVEVLPAGSIGGPVKSIPGLLSVSQPLASSGGREAETPRQMITRTSERLRHKGRASTPWDYERLVLENFPEVFKVKCFAAMTSRLPQPEPKRHSRHNRVDFSSGIQPAPGSVLVVVVPQQKRHNSERVFDPMLDANQLKDIQQLLKVASPQAQIEVRNPVYERMLIRCAVKLTAEAAREPGRFLKQLNQDIIDYISPWSGVGAPFRFGWSFKREEVEAYIRKRPYVDFVTKFSMLHITRAQRGGYRLEDTARKASVADVDKITPRFPWSLAIPNTTNILESISNSQRLAAVPTTIGQLTIGNTFIVGDK